MKKRNSLLFLLFLSLGSMAGNTDTIAVYSKAMHKNIPCVVITPAGYKQSGKKYPVLYLLHGYSGNYAQWPQTAPQLKTYVDEMSMIIVCPDGGYGSWYMDSPVDSSFRYETFVGGELITYIDNHYPTLADRGHRAITGLSMGGHGGFYLALRHKDLYGACGATSGGVDIRPFPNKWDLKKRLGDSACCQENWEKNTVINQAETLKNGELKIIFDCGIDDFFLQVNRNLHQLLLAKGVAHDYIERPGGHNGPYWHNSIDYQVLFFHKFFEGL
ncbi:MAG: esterase family protein [Bacteroidetes bacterium]|nr:esterase family protein [Bacteroidota bacterium]